MTSEVTSRSNAETVEKIGRAPERRRGKEQARGALLLTGPRRHRSPLGGPLHRTGGGAVGAERGRRVYVPAPHVQSGSAVGHAQHNEAEAAGSDPSLDLPGPDPCFPPSPASAVCRRKRPHPGEG